MERRRQDIVDAALAVNDGDGVILLTDMFGGTPSNLAISVMEETHAEVIAGLNLPMLIKLASVRAANRWKPASPTPRTRDAKYISVASWVLRARNDRPGHREHLQHPGPARPRQRKIRQLASGFDAEVHVTRDGVTVTPCRSWVC